MVDKQALIAWLRQQIELWPGPVADQYATIVLALEESVPTAEHDRRVTELLAANNELLFRARRAEDGRRRDRGERRLPQPTHRHYKGGYYRLLGTLWAEGSGEIMIRYACSRSGREWVRPAHEFFSTVDNNFLVRRFDPINGDCRGIEGVEAQLTLFEYMLLANASLVEKGAPAELVQQYGRDQWADAWRDGIGPEEAAVSELAERRAA